MERKMSTVNGYKLRATERALEKLRELVNGSREEVKAFIYTIISERTNKREYGVFLKDGKREFNYHKCKNVYVIFIVKDNFVTLVDLLTETEFKERRGI